MGYLLIKGEDLELVKLDTRDGNVSIKGLIISYSYLEDRKKKKTRKTVFFIVYLNDSIHSNLQFLYLVGIRYIPLWDTESSPETDGKGQKDRDEHLLYYLIYRFSPSLLLNIKTNKRRCHSPLLPITSCTGSTDCPSCLGTPSIADNLHTLFPSSLNHRYHLVRTSS